jgi:hypothetical protein
MGMDIDSIMLHEILPSQKFGCLKKAIPFAALICQIPMTKSQFPNNIQLSSFDDQEILIFLEFWSLFDYWCLGFGA